MKVILLETMGNLGSIGDVVDVKPGFARNFLLPQKKAASATDRNVKHVEHQRRVLEHRLSRLRDASEEQRKKLEKTGVKIKRKTGEHEKLFGSVTAIDIENALKAQGVIVSRKGITLADPIRKLGTYEVPVKLDGGVVAKLAVEVASEGA